MTPRKSIFIATIIISPILLFTLHSDATTAILPFEEEEEEIEKNRQLQNRQTNNQRKAPIIPETHQLDATLDSVFEYRRNKKNQMHLKPIVKHPWELIEEEEEGKGIHMVELQIQPVLTSDLDDVTLANIGEIQVSRLTCQPDSCRSNLKGYCDDCKVSYCMTNLDSMSERPYEYPNFMYVTDTDHCDAQSVQFDINRIHTTLKRHDDIAARQKTKPQTCRSLPLQLAIFEMGYTDANRATKSLVAADPSNLVFTDAQPFYEALMMCFNKRKELLRKNHCSQRNVIDLVRKIAYLMCRTCDPTYKTCMMKVWADATIAIEIFEMAFPNAELMFVYTDPNVYMGSVMDANRVDRAPCAKSRKLPSKVLRDAAKKVGRVVADMSVEEVCALEVKIIMEAAIKAKKKTGTVKIVHADDVLHALDTIKRTRDAKSNVKRNNVLSKGFSSEQKKKMHQAAARDRKGKMDFNQYQRNKRDKMKRVSKTMANAGAKFVEGAFAELENLSGFEDMV